MNFTIYTIGDKQHGMGHVVREIVLADELKRRGAGVVFATEHETVGFNRIRESGHSVADYHPDDFSWMNTYGGETLIIDLESRQEYGIDLHLLDAARAKFKKVIVVNGAGWKRATNGIGYDLQICQSVLEDAKGESGVLSGAEYLIVNPAYREALATFEGHIVVSMGGSDPHRLTGKAIESLRGAGRGIVGVVGPATDLNFYGESGGVKIIVAPPSLVSAFSGASLYVGALGMSAYEALCAGVPCLLTNWSADHERTSRELEKCGAAKNLGAWEAFDGGLLRESVENIFNERDVWESMSKAGKDLVDGRGVERVADVLLTPNAKETTEKVKEAKGKGATRGSQRLISDPVD